MVATSGGILAIQIKYHSCVQVCVLPFHLLVMFSSLEVHIGDLIDAQVTA